MKTAACQTLSKHNSEARTAFRLSVTDAARENPAQDAEFLRKLLARWIARRISRAHGTTCSGTQRKCERESNCKSPRGQ